MRLRPFFLLLLGSTLVGSPVFAQRDKKDVRSGYDRSARATLLHTETVYVAPDGEAQHVSEVTAGHEVVIVERSGAWLRVFANTDSKDNTEESDKADFGGDEQAETPTSGWIRDKGVVTPATANGAAILFGAAANFEDEASRPHAPKGAAGAAHLLYRHAANYFPTASIAAEAAWRSADVRWQLEKLDVSTLPSAKEQEAFLRPQIFDGEMKKLIKQYSGTKYAAMAAFDLIDNKLCGDWQGLPKCPEMEAGLYEKYAQQNPGGPKTAEALYDALYRQAVLVSMYTVEENKKRAGGAAARTQALAEQMVAKFPDSDFTARAQSVAYRVQQGIPVFGNDRD